MSNVMEEKGSLSINSENIFPIIKKWLYSDHDIFYRELISNGCDAITKMKKLEVMGEVTLPEDNEWKVTVQVSPEEKTIKIIDNGIGMTADEVKQYINQIAFSGAQAFVEKYKDKTNEDCIIGHFGLGFYSAFMVAHKVTIDTKSYKNEPAVHWESEEGVDFEMSEGTRSERGTEITLYLNEDSYEFSNEYRAKEVIEKYCSFMPTPIFFENVDAPAKEDTKADAAEKKDGEETNGGEAEEKKPQPLNDPNPLWTKHPNDCTEEEYKKFYRDVFHDYKEPLFWIHLNMDYPFNLKGILYFPKINTEYENLEGVIKLYSNQVFIADNIKEVIPEFLLLLKGVIDCPDLPLNVSRSALQNDGFVKKISDYITKKVADKLSGMCKVERESYEKYWDDISPFIKFGCLKDDKFSEKMKDYMLFKNLEGKYLTLEDYVKAAKEAAGEPEETPIVENADGTSATGDDNAEADETAEEKKQVVYYVTDERQQSQYINMFKEAGLDAIFLTHNIDQPYISKLEYDNKDIRFQRIDADLTETFKEEVTENEEDWKKLTDTVTELVKKALNKEKLTVKVEKLKNEKVASMITLSEDSRRMQDMMKMYNMGGMDPSMFGGEGETFVLNANHPLVKYVFEHKKSKNASVICEQLYDLAMLSHKPLAPEEMTKFIERSNEIMLLLTK
ncbi:MAG: molecular chaperone HtpG [Lachnospiraceae bacterium]|nr:molecular chaperone HtpG [Lachnospiraceae bacterium]